MHPPWWCCDLAQCLDLPVVVASFGACVDTEIDGVVLVVVVAAEVERTGMPPLVGGVLVSAEAEAVANLHGKPPAWVAQPLQKLVVPEGAGVSSTSVDLPAVGVIPALDTVEGGNGVEESDTPQQGAPHRGPPGPCTLNVGVVPDVGGLCGIEPGQSPQWSQVVAFTPVPVSALDLRPALRQPTGQSEHEGRGLPEPFDRAEP